MVSCQFFAVILDTISCLRRTIGCFTKFFGIKLEVPGYLWSSFWYWLTVMQVYDFKKGSLVQSLNRVMQERSYGLVGLFSTRLAQRCSSRILGEYIFWDEGAKHVWAYTSRDQALQTWLWWKPRTLWNNHVCHVRFARMIRSFDKFSLRRHFQSLHIVWVKSVASAKEYGSKHEGGYIICSKWLLRVDSLFIPSWSGQWEIRRYPKA